MTESDLTREEHLWFGDESRPLLGRLTLPNSGFALGGVLLLPSIGREGRLARRAMRTLAVLLARDGYVVLRMDHYGTADSSGTLEDGDFEKFWTEGVDYGVELLRSIGLQNVSCVAMRMGATIIGDALSSRDFGLTSLALWDPCESGRTYQREVRAFSTLQRDNIPAPDEDKPATRSEYVFSEDASARLNLVTLLHPATSPWAQRVLVVTREDRVISDRLKERCGAEHVEWDTTSEQGPMLETELPSSVQPLATIERIRAWLTAAPASTPVTYGDVPQTREVIVASDGTFPTRERIVELGPHKLFGIVSEPVADAYGPLIVLVNNINEDHVGPSRQWVELSRRWAGFGLRSVRFDFTEMGESSWSPELPPRSAYDATRANDIRDVVGELSPDDPSESVLIGLCSAVPLALNVALELRSHGVCVINSQVGTPIVRRGNRLENSGSGALRGFFGRAKGMLERRPRIVRNLWMISRLIFPSAYSLRVRSALTKNGTQILILAGPSEVKPLPPIPILHSIDQRRMVSTVNCRFQIVPGLDHDFMVPVGRTRAVGILDEFVLAKFADVSPLPPS
jgi:hypothetical protein